MGDDSGCARARFGPLWGAVEVGYRAGKWAQWSSEAGVTARGGLDPENRPGQPERAIGYPAN